MGKESLKVGALKERNMALAKEHATLNLSYKELMAKCNIHGRGEACYSKMLEKAKEKITKLKVKDNGSEEGGLARLSLGVKGNGSDEGRLARLSAGSEKGF
ncbi:hypothetical protein JHK82_055094 [Glycine max]|nr:hypothetical protein JHK82_055094 [Glycine max]